MGRDGGERGGGMARRPGSKGGAAAAAAPSKSPFEVKVNRQKFRILGRKARHAVGLPGVARSRAHAKRKQTLLKEHRERGRSGVFKDRRFGEHDAEMCPEDKMTKRFALEQQKKFENKNIYNLNDEENLTHFGHSLADIEKLNDVIDSDSDTEDRGSLSAELTAAHFGGLLSKKQSTEQQNEEDKNPKSRKELVDELIAKSKWEKRERQTQRENTVELTEKLNSDWKEIQTFLCHRTSKAETQNQVEEKVKPDEYDVLVRELGFEMKTQPCDRMKTEAELAKEEQEKLLQLEADRLYRMNWDPQKERERKPQHISADDLADGFLLDKEDRRLLSYNNAKADEDGKEGESEEDSDAGTDALDSYSERETCSEGKEIKRWKDNSRKQNEKQNVLRETAQELPYLIAAPESYEQLQSLMSGQTTDEQICIIERIQKTNHPSLAVGNKAKLENLFGFLLEYVGELACKKPPKLKTVDKLVTVLYELCQMFPTAASRHIKLLLQDASHKMEEVVEQKGHAAFPELDMLLYLKIIAVLFPTSDFWHPVVTPSFVYMSQLLTKCLVRTEQDVVKGLFVCGLFLEYVSMSQRFIPELVNFLLGILHLAAPNKEMQGYALLPPFTSQRKQSDLFVVCEKAGTETWQKQNISLRLLTKSEGKDQTEMNNLRLSCLHLALELVMRCAALYGALPSFREVMHPIRAVLASFPPAGELPAPLQELRDGVLEKLEVGGLYPPLVCGKKKPVPLKLFTPKIVKVLEFGRKQGSSKQDQERKSLIQKHKRELKGAVREIRRDNQFLAKMQLAEILERDSDRKGKVRQLFKNLAQQEGDWKAAKRKKF